VTVDENVVGVERHQKRREQPNARACPARCAWVASRQFFRQEINRDDGERSNDEHGRARKVEIQSEEAKSE
jgi:hypothetical protein